MLLRHAEDFDDDAFGALAVELGVEDALPGAEIEMTGEIRALVDRRWAEYGLRTVPTT